MKLQIIPNKLLVKQNDSIQRNTFMLKNKEQCKMIDITRYLQFMYKEGDLDIT
ncbi:hypothetical protein SDC9_169003 [bioreactor metagenome]|uniref:Uncharacterized protein n=1 Tax=bioreactor metagenome TaxID=1076179 RepID=A0A645GCN5_9ZZZZ